MQPPISTLRLGLNRSKQLIERDPVEDLRPNAVDDSKGYLGSVLRRINVDAKRSLPKRFCRARSFCLRRDYTKNTSLGIRPRQVCEPRWQATPDRRARRGRRPGRHRIVAAWPRREGGSPPPRCQGHRAALVAEADEPDSLIADVGHSSMPRTSCCDTFQSLSAFSVSRA
jgi:hypothetical protein